MPEAQDKKQTASEAQAKQLFSAQNLWLFLVGLTAFRLMALYLSPLNLSVDEAQYWLWSREFAFGYYSKPPLIAWLIGLSTGLFGLTEWAVRLLGPFLHLFISWILFLSARHLYGPSAGILAAGLWLLMPAVGLGSFVMSTDTPLLAAGSAGLYALLRADKAAQKSAPYWSGLAGACFGMAVLAKYAGVYFLLGGLIFIVTKRHQNLTIKIQSSLMLIVMALLVASPNLIWNLNNGLVTARHLGENANLAEPAYSLTQLASFWVGQFFVIGPVAGVCAVLAVLSARQTSARLLGFILPVLGLMSVQAFVKEANANWAMAAYPALIVMLAGWLAQKYDQQQKWQGRLSLSVNAVLAGVIMLVTASGSFGPFAPASDPLRHLRGWPELTTHLLPLIKEYDAQTILTERRGHAALLTWHLANIPVEVVIWDKDGAPHNHYELTRPYHPGRSGPVLAISEIPDIRWPDDRNWSPAIDKHEVAISKSDRPDRARRQIYIFIGR